LLLLEICQYPALLLGREASLYLLNRDKRARKAEVDIMAVLAKGRDRMGGGDPLQRMQEESYCLLILLKEK
jgi:hypothetical protein